MSAEFGVWENNPFSCGGSVLTCITLDESTALERKENGKTVYYSYGSTADDIEASPEDISRYAGRTVRTVDVFDMLLYSLPVLWT